MDFNISISGVFSDDNFVFGADEGRRDDFADDVE
jgi:hypothetical protein